MISRRILRIKVLQILYAHLKSDNDSYVNTEKELLFSVNKAYDLYHYLLLLILDISDLAEEKIESARNKKMPTQEDLNPKTNFTHNKVVDILKKNIQLSKYLSTNKLSWSEHPEITKGMYKKLIRTEVYQNYMALDKCSFNQDKDFIIAIIEELFADNELLSQILEEKSIYWNDDLEFILGMIVKTIAVLKENSSENIALLRLYKNDDDKVFVKDLLRKSIVDYDENKELIHKFTKNWEIDRIAFMDNLIMQQAITEVKHFTSIPVKVSLNEYIEISKYYSTEKSSLFINGILDKIFTYLKKEDKIKKIGRGLI